MSKKIIVLSGKQFSGKDTVAKFLLEFLPDFIRIGLGDAIKLEYGKQKNLTLEEIENNKSRYRADLIGLGDWGRAQDPDYWLKKIIEQEKNVIVPDMRVPHEMQVFKENGAISVRVESPQSQRARRGFLVKEDDPTETLLDEVTDWDFMVANDGTLEDLKDKSKVLAQDIMKKFTM
ncbi:MAG: hypothetical protein PHX18_02825 [Candidatus Gastranaerophilales bacterium]|nr:hypothetical protein [Candidatus Gastranaerophilales bacterium]